MSIYVTSDTRIDPGVVVTIAPSGEAVSDYAYTASGGDLSIAGVVNFSSSAEYVGGFTIDPYNPNGSLWIESTGELHVSSDNTNPYAWVRGYYAPSWGVGVQIDGLLDVSGPVAATGVESWSPGQTVHNTGVIQVYGGELGIGADFENGGYLDNSGEIAVSSDGPAFGVYTDLNTDITNSGTIFATTTSTIYASAAVFVWDGYEAGSDLHNSGVLQGDYAYYVSDGAGLASEIAAPEVVYNTGDLAGAVSTAFGDDIVHNAGTQEGFTDLGQGNDVYDDVSGINTAPIFGGEGADALIGGSSNEVLLGETGDDEISGGLGNDFLDGGHGSDAIDGGGGYDTASYLDSTAPLALDLGAGTANAGGSDQLRSIERVIGTRYSDVMTGSDTANQLEGNDGNDRIYGNGGNDTLIGDRGADTLTGGAGADTFVFNVGDGKDAIVDFDPAAGDKLSIWGYGHASSIVQSGSDTVITLSTADRITLKGVDAASFDTSSLIFHTAARAVSPTAFGPSQVITSDLVIRGNETWAFTDPDPVAIPDTSFPATGLYIQTLLSVPSAHLFNLGKISLTITQGSDDAIALRQQSALGDGPVQVYNEAPGLIETIVKNDARAIGVQGDIDLWNAGTIRATSAHSDALGVFDHRIYNSGTISATAEGHAVGVDAGGHGATDGVWNSGNIVASGGLASTGVIMRGSFFTFVNSGQITATDSTVAMDSVGLQLVSDSLQQTVFNTGVIQGDYAIKQITESTPPPDTPSTIYNSGELRGLVDLGSGVDQLYNNGLITGRVQLGNGNDLYDGRGGTEQGGVDGGGGNDTLLAGAGADELIGGLGNDTLSGGAGADILTGGSGNDRFRFETGSGADTITDFTAGGTDDVIVVVGYSGYQSLVQQGADTLVVFSDTDSLLLKNVLTTALTSDDFKFSAAPLDPTPVFPTPTPAPAAPATPASVTAPFAMVGTSSAETLQGKTGADSIFGEGGNDKLYGAAGDDHLDGGAGNDFLVGGSGADSLEGGAGADRFVVGRDGDDYIIDFHASEGDRIVVPLAASYTVEFLNNVGAAIIFTMNGHEVGEAIVRNASPDDVLAAIVKPTLTLMAGTAEADTLTGTTGDDDLRGYDGDDTLKGGLGDDLLEGGNGVDVLIGGAGDDVLSGGAGLDTASYADAAGGVKVELGFTEWQDTVSAGWDKIGTVENLTGSNYADQLGGDDSANVISGGKGDDTLTGWGGSDTLNGGPGNDAFHGGEGNDQLNGDTDADLLYGDNGADTLHGGIGDDTLYGDDGSNNYSGADKLYGDAGADALYGGGGGDKFIYTAVTDSTAAAHDVIYDFNPAAGDQIDLSAIDAQTQVAGDQAFTIVSSFDGHVGEAVFTYSAGDNTTTLTLDVNGDKTADFVLSIIGQVDGSAGFIL